MADSDGTTRHTPVVIVSSDTHIGPRLVEDLRPYCPRAFLDQFDAFATQVQDQRATVYERMEGLAEGHRVTPNRATRGHFEIDARLRDLDFDGVAGEVIFHGSQNEEPLPFGNFVLFLPERGDLELVGVGLQIYNRWIADFVTAEPERHVGLVYPPMWDVDATVREVRWGHAHGLRSVNFPAPRPTLRPYNDPQWEPLWTVCEELRMPLTTHSGVGDPEQWTGREATTLMSLEVRWLVQPARPRPPRLRGRVRAAPRSPAGADRAARRLVVVRAPGDGLRVDAPSRAARRPGAASPQRVLPHQRQHRREFPRALRGHRRARERVRAQRPVGIRLPARGQGTWRRPEDDTEPSVGRQALRRTFAGLPEEDVRLMLGVNAVRVHGLDSAALEAVAQRIGAPTFDEIDTPLEGVPAEPVCSRSVRSVRGRDRPFRLTVSRHPTRRRVRCPRVGAWDLRRRRCGLPGGGYGAAASATATTEAHVRRRRGRARIVGVLRDRARPSCLVESGVHRPLLGLGGEVMRGRRRWQPRVTGRSTPRPPRIGQLVGHPLR